MTVVIYPPTDLERVTSFKGEHTPFDVAIFEAIQKADVLEVLYPESEDDVSQCGEYLGFATEFIDWLKANPEPRFGQVVEELSWLSWCFDWDDCPPERALVKLAGVLCSIIYEDCQG